MWINDDLGILKLYPHPHTGPKWLHLGGWPTESTNLVGHAWTIDGFDLKLIWWSWATTELRPVDSGFMVLPKIGDEESQQHYVTWIVLNFSKASSIFQLE